MTTPDNGASAVSPFFRLGVEATLPSSSAVLFLEPRDLVVGVVSTSRAAAGFPSVNFFYKISNAESVSRLNMHCYNIALGPCVKTRYSAPVLLVSHTILCQCETIV